MTKSIDLIPTWYWPEGVPRRISMPRTTAYAATVERWAHRRPEAVALAGTIHTSYADLDRQVTTVSSNLRHRVGGDCNARIALIVGDEPDSATLLLGAISSGLDVLLLDGAAPAATRLERARAFGASLVVAADSAPFAGLTTLTPQEALGPTVGEPCGSAGEEGRVVFEWGTSFAFHPAITLLGWALAFRAFAEIQPSQGLFTTHPLGSWQGVTSLLVSLSAGSTHRLAFDLRSASPKHNRLDASGAWVAGDDIVALADDPQASRWLEAMEWIFVSIDGPFPPRARRRLARQLRSPILTIFGTPGTGPVAASAREWSIDQAVGIPFTGVDLVPLDDQRRPADPPWHLITAARVGVQSPLLVEGLEMDGTKQPIVSDGIVDTGRYGRMDANGFLYLL